MEPNTLILAISGIVFLSGIFLHQRRKNRESDLVREAKQRAEQRTVARRRAGLDHKHDSYAYDAKGIDVKHHGINREQDKIISMLFQEPSSKKRPITATPV